MIDRKNIVVIMTDQQRADLRALEGYPLDATPFLDRLAREGTWFDKAYTTMPICCAARVSLLTGRYPSAHGVQTNGQLKLARYEKDLFDVAREGGYATALSGKNHSHIDARAKLDYCYEIGHWGGGGEGRSAEEKAFDDWLKTLSQTSTGPAPFPLECQLPYRVVSAAQDWVGTLEGKPFLLWLSFAEPHNPYQAPEPYYSMFPAGSLPPLRATEKDRDAKGDKWAFYGGQTAHYLPDFRERIPQARANYLGMLRLIDDQIRRFVTFLEQSGLLENTLLVFLSDHGDFHGEYQLLKKGPEAPELLTRIPMQFSGAGVRPHSGPHPAHVSLADIMPTLCEAMELPIPRGVQGRSLWPLLAGEAYPEREFASAYAEHGYGGEYHTDRKPFDYGGVGSVRDGVSSFNELSRYTQSGRLRTIRKGKWKLNLDMRGKRELYDIEADPLELADLSGRDEYRELERDLLAELGAWMMRTQDESQPDSAEYPVLKYPRNYGFPPQKE
ncbi:sulfatase [Cohnella zeiphila]|uniref:Sulfatase-like hydrolase/transferase n=1 Tax=Cohnella zeiphila TaxID=2761120 RepID=A0A7X0VYS8_9BACL|nr:sulfatase-like hydrolase/transferase [Cohnella zeiphila]MBB6733253.1 sulfatase-like hydrolase/transferase [Cohnella zeiphila]